MTFFKRLNRYIAANFLLRFSQITVSFSLLIFLINLIDVMEKVRGSDVPFATSALMAFLQIPDSLNEVVPSLVMISAIVTFFLLSSKSEITIARSSGFSLWQILQPISFSAFFLGIFWITAFGPLSVVMGEKFNNLETRYVKKEKREMVAPSNGIWLKQTNINNPEEEIIIQAKKVYRSTLELDDVTLWFFNKNGQFYRKIDAQSMFLEDKFWLLQNITINSDEELNIKSKTYSIPTNLEAEFINQTVINNFQNVKLFSIFELPQLISDLQSAGFSSVKFKVYLNSLLSKPLLFVAMTLIACFFGINHTRNNKSVLMMFLGIAFGLVLYITSGIINALGSSGLIPIFSATWTIAIICLAIGTLMIYRKEKL